MSKDLLRKQEDETPVLKVDNGSRKQGRGVFGLFLTAIFAVFLSGTAWGQTSPTPINSVTGLNNMAAGGNYIITGDFDAANYTPTLSTAFTGTLTAQAKSDGTYPIISGLTRPLFNTVSGATISNIMLKNVQIADHTGPTGAIAGTADGTTKIYNCGILPTETVYDNKGSIAGFNGSYLGSSDSYCGSLVGKLDGSARVINCFSYATIIEGTTVAGIVGYNSFSSLSDNLKTMVMNCMFYGEITARPPTSTSISPVYGGQKITNVGPDKGLNTFNYFRYEAAYSTGGIITDYNCALGAEERFLRRFEFHRTLLNSNRELAAYYVDATLPDLTGGEKRYDKSKIAKWVLDKSIAPCPVLKVQNTYPTVVNIDAANAAPIDADKQHYNEGRKLGTLTVNIEMGSGAVFSAPSGAAILSGKSQITLNITDKDPENYNFNYGKVQLPYYNEVGTKNYNDNRVVTGWKIVNIEGGEKGTFTAADEFGGYNFADREHWAKDYYGTGGANRIFNQGAYWDVPEGVTAITIQPYWAKCVYLADSHYDVTYSATYGNNYNGNSTSVTTMGQRYINDHSYDINGSSQKVYTEVSNARNALQSNASRTPYDYAIVLVGNYHRYQGRANNSITGNKYDNTGTTGAGYPYTFMSADLDFDNEPDYVFCYQHGYLRTGVSPIRFDFIHLTGLGMAQKVDGTNFSPEPGTFWNYGWFEVTNTALIKLSAIEYVTNKQVDAPLILHGGIYGNLFSYQGNEANGDLPRTPYIHVGGNVHFDVFANGSHMNNKQFTPHVPISVTGGDFDQFYLSGYTLPLSSVGAPNQQADDAECYIDGGHFGEVAGAGMWKVDGNVGWSINHADMGSFFGGGINAAYPVSGNISTTIKDSRIEMYCGGPKFGDMTEGKTVNTSATDCVFGTFYGAGYGGNSFNRVSANQENNVYAIRWNKWNDWVGGSYKRAYNNTYSGISTDYELIFFQYSGGEMLHNVAQLYVSYASFSLAKTKTVNSSLLRCIVNNDYYGGGNLGKVEGNVESTLEDCTIGGSAFGAGYSATVPTIDVYPKLDNLNSNTQFTEPYFDDGAGVYVEPGYPASVEYKWKHADAVSTNNEFEDPATGGHFILTTEDLNTLGTVTGDATLTIKGNSIIYNNVFGGGNESAVTNNTSVFLEDRSKVFGNVYGGGNMGKVGGNTKVIFKGRTDQSTNNNNQNNND